MNKLFCIFFFFSFLQFVSDVFPIAAVWYLSDGFLLPAHLYYVVYFFFFTSKFLFLFYIYFIFYLNTMRLFSCVEIITYVSHLMSLPASTCQGRVRCSCLCLCLCFIENYHLCFIAKQSKTHSIFVVYLH